jgi:5-methyltetrahydrofolate--homocysteine methyltransferase
MELLNKISEHLRRGDDEQVYDLTRQAINEGIGPKEILDSGLIEGMNVVGEEFRKHEIFLPDVLLAAKAMYAGMDQLKPLLIKEGVPSVGKIAIGTVHGDLHDIGKNLVGIMLKGAGFDVIDLGKDVSADKFVQSVTEDGVKVIGMSALLTTTMPVMKRVIDLLRERELDGTVKTIIGGAPVSEEYAVEIGATAYAYDAANAVDRVKALVSEI